LIKSYRVVGVQHTADGLRRTLRFLHAGAPLAEMTRSSRFVVINETRDINPSAPSKCEGMRIGVELSKKELELVTRNVRSGVVPAPHDPDHFWHVIVQYASREGLELVPVDDHRMKAFYPAAMEKAKRLRETGQSQRADALEHRALELYIPRRERLMSRRIAEEGLEISLVGRYHSEHIARILNQKHGLSAFPLTTASAMTELMLQHLPEFKRFGRAREEYDARHPL